MNFMQEKRFKTAHFSLNYAQGPNNGPPLLLLHGSLSRWQAFLPLLSDLTQQWHVYALDFRGHGHSDRIPGHYKFDDYVSDVAKFIIEEMGDSPIILGHSLGAMVAMAVAAQHPGNVAALIMGDPPFSFDTVFNFANQQKEVFLEGSAILAKAEGREKLKSFLKNMPTIDKKTGQVIKMSEQFDEDHIWYDFYAQSLESVDVEIFYSLFPENISKTFSSYTPQQFLPAITCPSLILRGNIKFGSLSYEDEVKQALALLPNGKDILFPQVGHGLYYDDKEAVLNAIMRFLNDLKEL